MTRTGLAESWPAIESALSPLWPDETIRLVRLEWLDGGAIQQNWLVDLLVGGNLRKLVLRTDSASKLPSSLSRAKEFAVLRLAYERGVAAPYPVGLIESSQAIGRPFFLMERHEGTAKGALVVDDLSLCPDRQALTQRLGRELALLHQIRPGDHQLNFLGNIPEDPAQVMIGLLRQHLSLMDGKWPVIEWGLRWAERQRPEAAKISLVHQDFRSGNLLLGQEGLSAVLDWEFAGWGDPMSDLGWLCARCWRYSRPYLEAGGLGKRHDLYTGYEAVSGGTVDHERVLFWEIMAHLRWAVIALQQAGRHHQGGEASLELALTAYVLPTLEQEILAACGPVS